MGGFVLISTWRPAALYLKKKKKPAPNYSFFGILKRAFLKKLFFRKDLGKKPHEFSYNYFRPEKDSPKELIFF